MSAAVDWTRRRLPACLAGAALLFYVSGVLAVVAAGDEWRMMAQETLPVAMRVRGLVAMLVQPLAPALALLFGAGLLWRLDLLLGRSLPRIHR